MTGLSALAVWVSAALVPAAASAAAWLGDLAGALLRVSMEGALWIVLALLLVRAVPALPARLRCALWWAVSLKLVAGLVLALTWPAPLELAVLPAAESGPATVAYQAGPASTGPPATYPAPAADPDPLASVRAGLPASSGAVEPQGPPLFPAVAGAAWLLGLLALAAAGLRRHLHRRRARRELRPVTDPDILELHRRLAHRFDVDPPPLVTSSRVGTPQLAGWLRPRLLLPAALAGDECAVDRGSDLELALAHELAHLQRRDLVWGVVPWAARFAFFFHPLAPLALREYLLAREAACDAAVLETLDASPRAYGRLLLTWGTVRPGESAVATTLGNPRQLKRRLTMLQTATAKAGTRRLLTRYLPLAAALPILLALVPIRLVAAPGPETDAGSEPAAPVVAEDGSQAGGSYAYTWSHDEGEPMIYLQGENKSVGFSTSSGQWDRVRTLQRGDEALVWFVRDGQEYVIRDPALLAEVKRAYRPVMELGERQGSLGSDQGELGTEQGELGARQGRLGAEQGELAAQQAVLAAELARLAADRAAREFDGDGLSDAERRRIEERTREVRAEMETLREQIDDLGDRQRALGDEQRELGARQRALGERQRELGKQQRQASDAARQAVNDILDRALANGKAEPVG